MIKCKNKEEFEKLMIYIFFDSERAKLQYDEILNLEYEFIQSALGIAQEEHDIADKSCEDIELDLFEEFLKGNYKYANQEYPVYVQWDIRRWGCESAASVYIFEVFSESEISIEHLMNQQAEANKERDQRRALYAELKKLKAEQSGII